MKIFVGIDNASKSHYVKIIDETAAEISSFELNNNLKDFEDLHKRLTKIKGQKLIGMECPHGPLVDFLRNKEYNLYPLNPLKIKRFKQASVLSENKTDKVDALAIAHFLKSNWKNLRKVHFSSFEIEKLNILRVSHDRITCEHARYTNKLIFVIRQYFPLYNQLFSISAPKILLNMIIAYPEWSDLKNQSKEEIESFLKANHYRMPRHIKGVIDKIENYDQVIAPEVTEVLKREAQMLAHILLVLKEELLSLEKQMSNILEHHQLGPVLKSLPGAGVILAGKILALLGDNKDRFKKANEIQCLFGTAPANYQSGPYHKVLMRRACNKKARAILYQFAFASLQYSKWAREYYDSQKNKGKTHSVAVRALSNKWLKIIFQMWQQKKIYRSELIEKKSAVA